ncbi:hypothetical protein [Achromobacter phage emuu_LB7]|nr:hypothetical protein [Achromobacter phage emuu_LB7]
MGPLAQIFYKNFGHGGVYPDWDLQPNKLQKF